MQLQSDKAHRNDEIKTQFRAREGYYKLMNSPDYSQRSQRAMGFSTGTANSNSSTASNEKTFIKISLVTMNNNNHNGDHQLQPSGSRISAHSQLQHQNSLSSSTTLTNRSQQQKNPNSPTSSPNQNGGSNVHINYARNPRVRDTKICFNVGKELFVYNYEGVRNGPDASNPIYKRSYKGSSPTCHDFNQAIASSGQICLLVGFSHGQVQLINLNGSDDSESVKEFNVDRLIDKTRVTCIKWLPNSPSLFLVAHASGQLYLYKVDLPCGPTAPFYQIYKQSEGVVVYTCKTKTPRNPIYKWTIGAQANVAAATNANLACSSTSLNSIENESHSLNEFVFSPCAKYLACVSQDGFLRVFCYDTMELIGRARSYYGGLSCVCWSPDGKYVVTGGEDDLITVWSFVERRVVARGVGHKSWVSVVAFDTFYSGYELNNDDVDNDDEDEDDEELKELDDDDMGDDMIDQNETRISSRLNRTGTNNPSTTSYRFGSVGQDTQLCFWDLNDDLLRQPIAKNRFSSIGGANSVINLDDISASLDNNVDATLTSSQNNTTQLNNTSTSNSNQRNGTTTGYNSHTLEPQSKSKTSAFTKTFSLVGKRDKRKIIGNMSNNLDCSPTGLVDDPIKLLGSPICPRMNEIPILEPLVCKKISFERLTSLIFCQGGFITSCQDGYVFSWARPSRRPVRYSPSASNEELRVIDVGTSSAV